MVDQRFVCLYPQYSYCGNSNCPLSKYCSVFHTYEVPLITDLRLSKKNRVSKTEEEKKLHAKLYRYYNNIWGDFVEKNKKRNRKWYCEHREQILAAKRKPPSMKLPIVIQCKYSCSTCPFEECTLELYETRKQYMELYYKKFHEKILEKKALYRKANRVKLSNMEKLRNYRKRKYTLRECILVSTNNMQVPKIEGREGTLCIIKINGNPYFSFIAKDLEFSFRRRIADVEGEISDAECNSIYFTDCKKYKYIFHM